MTLKELIQTAKEDPHATAEEGKVSVEFNGGVPFYSIDDEECTASQAQEALENVD